MWDYTIWADPMYKKLATKALNNTITTNEMKQLVEALKYEPELAIEYGLTPNILPSFVESYPELALSLMMALNSHPRISEYLSKFSINIRYYYVLFVQLQLSQQQKTVIFMLREHIEIPVLYIYLLIAQGIESCLSNSKKKDKDRVYFPLFNLSREKTIQI